MSTCETCRFWWPQDTTAKTPDYRSGICRRRSPQVDPTNFNKWPTTYTLDWCGEHEEKARQKPVLVPEGFEPKPGAANVVDRLPRPLGKATEPGGR